MPILTTERLILRPMVRPTTRLVKWLNDQHLMRYSENRHVIHTFESEELYITTAISQGHIWTINKVLAADTPDHFRMIGTITARYDLPNLVAELGILIGQEHGQGFGREAWTTVMEWLLSTPTAIRKVEAGCMAANEAMVRIFKATGMLFEGERRKHFLFNNEPVSMVMYGKMRGATGG